MSAVEVVQIPVSVDGPRGVNSFLVIGSQPIIVDTGIPGSAPQILAALAARGYEPDTVPLIVITHAHVDHVGDACTLREATGAAVVAHRLDAPMIVRGVSAPVRGRTPAAQAMVDGMGTALTPPFRRFEPDIIVDEVFSLSAAGVPARLVHAPGHTDGGLALVIEDGQVILGDLIAGSPDNPTTAGLGPFATDADAMINSVRQLITPGPTRVYCGHGGPFEPADLDVLVEALSDRVAER